MRNEASDNFPQNFSPEINDAMAKCVDLELTPHFPFHAQIMYNNLQYRSNNVIHRNQNRK